MATKARQQYFADEVSLSKEKREFSIADEIQQKIDSIEEGAQVNKIETVKVNGTALVPDAYKAVNIDVPEVIDNLYTVDSDNALSAKQGKLLYDYIQNIASRGRFLSNWNSATGLPITNPSESPYPYKSGDYFAVSNVATGGGTNYRPDGSSYTIGQASTVVETDSVDVSDFYFYDGTNWLLLKNSGRSGAVDSALSTTSTNPVENRVITNALNGKQETLIAGNNIQIAADGKTISATDTTYSAGANISIDANNEISATDTTYTAGTNVQISNQNVISATDTKYTAGTGINIDANNVISNTQTSAEWGNITGTLSNQTDLQTALDAKQDDMVILKYGISTWNDFITAYNKNGVVYCRASSNSNPASGSQTRLAFMAYVNNETTPTEVEFQYYRSRSSHSTAANVLDEVYVYKLVSTNGGTWTVTQRDTAAKPLAGTGIGLTYNASGMTISADTTTLATKTDLNSKQDTLVSGTNIKTVNNESLLGTGNITISAPIYNAGPGIEINNNSISAKAGTGIAVGDGSPDYSAMRGPCPNGYHIPLHTEHQDLVNMWTALGFGTSSGIDFVTYFHTPTSCSRWSNGNNQGFSGVAISWSANKAPDGFYVLSAYADPAYPSENYVETEYILGLYESLGHPIRAFKDAPVIPDSNWTTVYQGTGSAGIYHNSTLGLISISSDGTNWITLKDKNEGATTVWNYGDTLSAANVGNVYQRGNNYGFPRTGTITTSNTQVDASNYGPGNYYSSSTFITTTPYRDSSQNRNLRGGVTGIVVHPNGITNTGVLSVNGQTGNVTVEEPIEYTAGEGIAIGTVHSDMQGPAPDGFHIPMQSEWEALCEILTSTFSMASNATTMGTYLKMPAAGFRYWNDAAVYRVGEYGEYWSSTPYSRIAFSLRFDSSHLDTDKDDTRAFGLSLRCFKDKPVIPTSSWTTLYDGSSVATGAGVFYNATDGLISASGDGTTRYTIMDKNLGATTVYNQGDTLTDANCGNFYQWGNNYGFSHSGTVTTSSTKVDASNYGPGNYYNSSTFITTTSNIHDWSSVINNNLWGGETQGTWMSDEGNSIINTGVLSVNGQTGDVTVEEPIEYTAGNGILIGNLSISSRQGPCEEGFHVPSAADWQGVETIMNGLGFFDGADWDTKLHLPKAGYRRYSDGEKVVGYSGATGVYWSTSRDSDTYSYKVFTLAFDSSNVGTRESECRAIAASIRPFKNAYVAPDATWTVIYGTLGSAGIFWNQTEGLISITDGTNGYTMADKNLGATTVYSSGNTLSEANCGYLYQWGNNYAFPWSGSVTTSSTLVDASSYGPGNYYSSSTFITVSSNPRDWSSVQNNDLWGDTTNTTTNINNAISNTGVLSVNGQTGDISIETFQLAPNSPLTPKYRRYGTQAQYEALTQYYTDEPGDTVYFTI